jgi:hypothetical protein
LNNLISGLAVNFVGPEYLKLLFQAFVVIVGFLMLSGAVNTSIIGSNGVLNRVSEDGVLTAWFRAPHKRFGTTYRLINLIAILQLITIFGSRGNVFILGEAYAFGVIWSFTFNAVATVVLRFRRPEAREWKVPVNIRVGRLEIPVGLIIIALILVSIALTNLLTKQIATISGIAFTALFFILFTVSERINRRKLDRTLSMLDRFQLQHNETISQEAVGARPGNVLVAVRDYNTLGHLEHALEHTNTEEKDVVVVTTRLVSGPDGGESELYDENLFTDYEQHLFTRVVALAEKHGKPVELAIVPATNIFDAIAQTSLRLDSSEIVAGLSSKMTAQDQARELGRAWERLPEKPRRQVCLKIVGPNKQEHTVYLGAHAPTLTEADINLIHKIWIEVSRVPARQRIHHRDVVRVALDRLERDLRGQTDVMLDFYKVQRREQEKDRPRRDKADDRNPDRDK